MDPISLTLGLLPLIAGAVKGAKKTRVKLHALVKYADEAKRMYLRFMIQESRVNSQSALLIHHARAVPLNDVNIKDKLLKNTPRSLQAELSLDDDKIKNYLGDSYDTCRELFGEIHSKMALIAKMLERFEPGEAGKDPKVFEKLAKGIAFAFRETKCTELIDDLQAALDGLTQINRDRRDLQVGPNTESLTNPEFAPKSSIQPSLRFPPFERVTKATSDLHLALSSAFGCSGSFKPLETATKHQAKLYIDAFKHGEEIRSTLLLSCQCNPDDDTYDGTKLLSLTVKSVETWDASSSEPVHERPLTKKMRSGTSTVPAASNKEIEQAQQNSAHTEPQHFEFCTCLHKGCCSSGTIKQKGQGKAESSLGSRSLHTLSTPGYSHIFFPTNLTGYCRISNPAEDFISLQEAFGYEPEPNFTKLDQLKLAMNIANALLKFHDTPWINEFWGVRDLSLVSMGSGGIGTSLGQSMRTLHVGLDLAAGVNHKPLPHSSSSAAALSQQTLLARRPKGTPDEPPLQTLDLGTVRGSMQLHGIDNLPLYYLGVILLQIDRWDHINEDDLIQVNRLAKNKPRLGERYAYIVQKCLRCCFAQAREADFDLSDSRLQTDVYREVVCGITQIMEGLTIDDDQ